MNPAAQFCSRPTAEQLAAFAKLTPAERFVWLTDFLALCYELAPPEARAQWRMHKARQHDSRQPFVPRGLK